MSLEDRSLFQRSVNKILYLYLESKAGSLVCLLAKDELGAELDEAEAEVDDPELDE